jgi:hypothetical protein
MSNKLCRYFTKRPIAVFTGLLLVMSATTAAAAPAPASTHTSAPTLQQAQHAILRVTKGRGYLRHCHNQRHALICEVIDPVFVQVGDGVWSPAGQITYAIIATWRNRDVQVRRNWYMYQKSDQVSVPVVVTNSGSGSDAS